MMTLVAPHAQRDATGLYDAAGLAVQAINRVRAATVLSIALPK
jgi:hypothetical protein